MRLRRLVRGSPLRRLSPSCATRPRRIAVYLSSHGLGHAVRAAAVLDELRRLASIELAVIGPCERRVWPAALSALTTEWCSDRCDVGVVQADDVTVDAAGTRAALDAWLTRLNDVVDREASRLAAGRFDLVVGDVPSPAFQAASRVQIPSVAIANFSWDWIYSELGFAAAAEAAGRGYAQAGLLLEAVPFAPMTAFPRRVNVGLIAREPSDRRAVTRVALGANDGQSLVLLAFQPSSAPGLRLPPQRSGRRYVVPAGWPGDSRDDTAVLEHGSRFEDAIAAADVVVGKPGYGLIGDIEAAGARFLYVPRPGFPENAVLEAHLGARAATSSIAATTLAAGDWQDELASLEREAAPAKADARGAARAARELARMLGIDTGAVAE